MKLKITITSLMCLVATLALPLAASAQYYDSYYSPYNNYYGGYSQDYNYSPYSYGNYSGYSGYPSYTLRPSSTNNNKSATHELRYVTDLDGNIVGEYRSSGGGYNAYYGKSGSSYSPNTIIDKVSTYTVEMKSNRYTPSTLTIKKGSTVKWVNKDNTSHTVTGDKSSYNISSKTLKKNDTYSKKFTTTGTYYYHCKNHSNMKAKIIVVN